MVVQLLSQAYACLTSSRLVGLGHKIVNAQQTLLWFYWFSVYVMAIWKGKKQVSCPEELLMAGKW